MFSLITATFLRTHHFSGLFVDLAEEQLIVVIVVCVLVQTSHHVCKTHASIALSLHENALIKTMTLTHLNTGLVLKLASARYAHHSQSGSEHPCTINICAESILVKHTFI